MPRVEPAEGQAYSDAVSVVVVGGGACGLCAALAASQAGADVLVLERDHTPTGTTSMSSGLIPAAGTKAQRAAGIVDDTPDRFAADIVNKTGGRTDLRMARHIAEQATATVDWLTEDLGLPLTLVTSAQLPGHSRLRLHGSPNRSGSEFMAGLHQTAVDRGVAILTQAQVETLFAEEDGRIRGVGLRRPDGSMEVIGCGAAVLACCGFAANAELVRRFIPEIAQGVAHSHPGANGDALTWGQALGAAAADLSGYQGHASLAHGHGLLIHWIVMGQGAIQVNLEGRRFADESRGYSEQAVDVLAQPGAVAWDIYDARVHAWMQEFEEYRDAMSVGAIRSANDVNALAQVTGLPLVALTETLQTCAEAAAGRRRDTLGRDFTASPPLVAPYHAVKVTGALFHTQGGLVVDEEARVLRPDGGRLPNLFAGGGAARGVSGPSASGYLAGNGLLTATTLGRIAGLSAARLVA